MKTHTLEITVKVKVQSDLPIEHLIDEFGQETDYNFSDTDNVRIVATEILNVE